MRWTMVAALLANAGCADKGDDTGTTGPTDAEIDAAIVGYSGWSQSPGWVGVNAGTGPHGDFVQIWWSEVALSAFEAGDALLPAGSVIVKESYADSAGAERTAITVMWKQEPSAWTWAKLDAAGEVEDAGDLDMCSGCHASGTDAVLSETW